MLQLRIILLFSGFIGVVYKSYDFANSSSEQINHLLKMELKVLRYQGEEGRAEVPREGRAAECRLGAPCSPALPGGAGRWQSSRAEPRRQPSIPSSCCSVRQESYLKPGSFAEELRLNFCTIRGKIVILLPLWFA